MNKLSLNSRMSDIFVLAYLIGTLYLRFQVEEQLEGHLLVSLLLGGFALLFLWALNKSGFIRPTWFGFFKN